MPPRHALDVLMAFRMDVTKLRYENWDEVIHYCRYSAMPVGRFMLDVHGESASTWAASDALCAGLQINNHLQDCAKDFRDLNRVYLPRDALAAAGASVEMLGEAKSLAADVAMPARARGADRNAAQRGQGAGAEVKDFRLGLEVSVIQAFADKIVGMLKVRDPLSERVHFARSNCSAIASAASPARSPAARWGGGPNPSRRPAHDAADGGGQRKLRHHRIRQLVLCRDAHPAARAARGDVPDLQFLPAGRRHRRFRRPAGRAARRAPAMARRHRRAVSAAIRRRGCRITRPRCAPSV